MTPTPRTDLDALRGQLIGPYNPLERISEAEDTICECNHWYEEHEWFLADDGRRHILHEEFGENGEADTACAIEECDCPRYRFGVELNTPQAITDRVGDPRGEHRAECFCALCREEQS
jgi:hypothetical protein